MNEKNYDLLCEKSYSLEHVTVEHSQVDSANKTFLESGSQKSAEDANTHLESTACSPLGRDSKVACSNIYPSDLKSKESAAPFFFGQIVSEISDFNLIFESFATDQAPLTTREYRLAVADLFRELGDDIKQKGSIGLEHIKSHIFSLKSRGLRQNTINKKLSALSSFCEHLIACEQMSSNPVKKLPKSTSKRAKDTPPPATLKSWEVRKIFEALDPKKKNYLKHRALLGVGFYAGLREQEIRNLRIKNIGVSEGIRVINTIAKGECMHLIPIHPILGVYLDAYLLDLNSRGIDTSDPEQVIFNCGRKGFSNRPFSQEGLWHLFNRSLDRAGIVRDTGKRYSPHCMRRSMGNNMEEKNVPLFRIQKAYGHASADTTVGYLDREEKLDKSAIWQISY